MRRGGRLPILFTAAWLLCATSVSAQNGPPLNPGDPYGLFTNLASRFLRSELNLNLDRIQIWPTNQYTPAVHRLLQVAANIVDATTNRYNNEYPYFPSVFRPWFTNDGGSIFICGYGEVGVPPLTNAWRDLSQPAHRDALQPTDYIYGVPVVIGVKKGFPNFNEATIESTVQVSRRLQVTRPAWNAPQNFWHTNQMLTLGISNVVALEAWNSYITNYQRAVDIYVSVMVTIELTNSDGYSKTFQSNLPTFTLVASNAWRGFNAVSPTASQSFIVPLRANINFLPPSPYDSDTHSFTTNVPAAWDDTSAGFPNPEWKLSTSNHVRFFMLDHDTQRIIDFVTMDGLGSTRHLNAEWAVPLTGVPFAFRELWSTNLINGLPVGVLDQILISLGDPSAGSGANTEDWEKYGLDNPALAQRDYAIDYFRAMYGYPGLKYSGLVNTSLVQQVPFTPSTRTRQTIVWQANDPLVREMPQYFDRLTNSVGRLDLTETATSTVNITNVNQRYEPWSGTFNSTGNAQTLYNLALKDPLATSSDSRDIPNNEPLSVELLGRIHRGTPWQTLYLKSSAIDLPNWKQWSAISNTTIALQTMPTNDWRLVKLLCSMLNTNDPRQLLSINETSSDVWQSGFDGISALTNTTPDFLLFNPSLPRQYESIILTSNSPLSIATASAINDARSRAGYGRFSSLEDVMSVSGLSTNAPWLNQSTATQVRYGISDEVYEKFLSQLLPRLRIDSVGSMSAESGGSRLRFTGYDNHAYVIEASSDLSGWQPLSTNYPVNGEFEFTDPSPSNSQRFYRSVLLN